MVFHDRDEVTNVYYILVLYIHHTLQTMDEYSLRFLTTSCFDGNVYLNLHGLDV